MIKDTVTDKLKPSPHRPNDQLTPTTPAEKATKKVTFQQPLDGKEDASEKSRNSEIDFKTPLLPVNMKSLFLRPDNTEGSDLLSYPEYVQYQQDMYDRMLQRVLQTNYGFTNQGKLKMSDPDAMDAFQKLELAKYKQQRELYIKEQSDYANLIRQKGGIEDHGKYVQSNISFTQMGSKDSLDDSIDKEIWETRHKKWKIDAEYNRKVTTSEKKALLYDLRLMQRISEFPNGYLLKRALAKDLLHVPNGPQQDRVRRTRSLEPDCEPLQVDQRLMAVNVIKNPLKTIREPGDEFNYDIAGFSIHQEKSMDGIIDTKEANVQTSDVYQLTAELVYHQIETKVQNYIKNLYDPVGKKQFSLQEQTNNFHVELEKVKMEIVDMKQTVIRNLNPQREFNKVHQIIGSLDEQCQTLRTQIETLHRDVTNAVDKHQTKIRTNSEELMQLKQKIFQREDSNFKVGEVLDSFKERLLAQFKTITDEFTGELIKLDKRYADLNHNTQLSLKKQTDSELLLQKLNKLISDHKDKLSNVMKEQERMKSLYTFKDRLEMVEGQIRSDTIGFNLKIEDLKKFIQVNSISKEDTFRLCFNMQLNCCEALFDLGKHKVGQLINANNPKYPPEVQCLLNLYDWQEKISAKQMSAKRPIVDWLDQLKINDRCFQTSWDLNLNRLRCQASTMMIGRLNEVRKRKDSGQNFKQQSRFKSFEEATAQMTKKKRPTSVELKANLKPIHTKVIKKKIEFMEFEQLRKAIEELQNASKPKENWINKLQSQISVISDATKKPNIKQEKSLQSKKQVTFKEQKTEKKKFVKTEPIPYTQEINENPEQVNTETAQTQAQVTVQVSDIKTEEVLKQKTNLSQPKEPAEPEQIKTTSKERVVAQGLPMSKPRSSLAGSNNSRDNTPPKSRMSLFSSEMAIKLTEKFNNTAESLANQQPKEEEKRTVTFEPSESIQQVIQQKEETQVDQENINQSKSQPESSQSFQSSSVSSSRQSDEKLPSRTLTDISQNFIKEIKRTGSKHKDQSTVDKQQIKAKIKLSQNSSLSSRGYSSSDSNEITSNVMSQFSKQSKQYRLKKARKESKASSSEQYLTQQAISEVLQDYIQRDEVIIVLRDLQEEMQSQFKTEARLISDSRAQRLHLELTEKMQQQESEITSKFGKEILELKQQFNHKIFEVQADNKNKFKDIKKVELPNVINKINLQIDSNVNAVREEISKHQETTLRSFFDLKLNIEGFNQKVDATRKRVTALISDFDSRINVLKKTEEKTNQILSDFKYELLNQARIISTLVELDFIQQSLDFQDEFDRSQMTLWGMKEVNMTIEDLCNGQLAKIAAQKDSESKPDIGIGTEGKFAIKLSDECMNCGDERMKKKINQAFKMACIQYGSSPVLYRGQKFDRKKLIEVKRTMLDCEWEKTLQNAPFDQLFGKMNTSGVFYDNFQNKLQFLTNGKHFTQKKIIEIFNQIDQKQFSTLAALTEESPTFPSECSQLIDGRDNRKYVGLSKVTHPNVLVQRYDANKDQRNAEEQLSPREFDLKIRKEKLLNESKYAAQIASLDRLVRQQLEKPGDSMIDAKTKSMMQLRTKDNLVTFANQQEPQTKIDIQLQESVNLRKPKVSPGSVLRPINTSGGDMKDMAIDTRSLKTGMSFETTRSKHQNGKLSPIKAETKLSRLPNQNSQRDDIPLIELRQLIGRDRKKMITDGIMKEFGKIDNYFQMEVAPVEQSDSSARKTMQGQLTKHNLLLPNQIDFDILLSHQQPAKPMTSQHAHHRFETNKAHSFTTQLLPGLKTQGFESDEAKPQGEKIQGIVAKKINLAHSHNRSVDEGHNQGEVIINTLKEIARQKKNLNN